MKKLWRSLADMIHIYFLYEIHKIHKPYTLSGIKESIKLLKMYKDRENIA